MEMKDKIQNALDEARILVLGVQVLVGFQFQAVFQPGFAKLSPLSQQLQMASLTGLLIAYALLMAPAAYQRIVEEGRISRAFHEFITRIMTPALLPFALGMGIALYTAIERYDGGLLAMVGGIGIGLLALFFWYGLEALVCLRRRRKKETTMNDRAEATPPEAPTPLSDKIRFVMTEARVVLPGAQALLGFQFSVLLTEAFAALPHPLHYAHLTCLALVGLSTVFLMAPAAYHRVVEDGEDTEEVHTFASRMLMAAMALLALGTSGDFGLVLWKVTRSPALSIGMGIGALSLFWGFWFGYMLYRRARKSTSGTQAALPEWRQRKA